ncbi:hypothetical protein GCM10010387_00540 [Streptomyces inusitatus]|uniref:Uncharacterized protein n=1 Tax=Streptomyces inusitatus TaxID=68221 RepID=A0A918PJ47_9ACTN|nr:hypothetical protein [Streptomyces inusitatus]GGZ12559.1 hypothetical protein GCM10010387_00540 [Streptomyces inusitatus]
MNATQQYLLDCHRAARLGERMPPQPGRHDWQMIRELDGRTPAVLSAEAGRDPGARARPGGGRSSAVRALVASLLRRGRARTRTRSCA